MSSMFGTLAYRLDQESVHAKGASAVKEAAKLGREALGSAAHVSYAGHRRVSI
jgi:hypothetical protein